MSNLDDLAYPLALQNELALGFHPFAHDMYWSLLPWQLNSQRFDNDAICPGFTVDSRLSIAYQKKTLESGRGSPLPVVSTIRRCVGLFDPSVQNRAQTVNNMSKEERRGRQTHSIIDGVYYWRVG